MSDIKVPCKRCNRPSSVKELVLDPVYQLMVCPICVKERKDKEIVEIELQKKRDKPVMNNVHGTVMHEPRKANTDTTNNGEKTNISCPKCKYKILYNNITKTPKLCPYCGTKISNTFEY